jgi:hypothetical protein
VRGYGDSCRKSPLRPRRYLPRHRGGASDVRGGDLWQLRLGCGHGVLGEAGLNVQLRHLFNASTIHGSIHYYVEFSSNLVLTMSLNLESASTESDDLYQTSASSCQLTWNSLDKLASSTFISELVIYIYLTSHQNLQMHVCSKLA